MYETRAAKDTRAALGSPITQRARVADFLNGDRNDEAGFVVGCKGVQVEEKELSRRDVVVVGGGPVGMWLAAELHRGGIRAVGLERRGERPPPSKALPRH